MKRPPIYPSFAERAFSVMEMLIGIGIILVLAALTVPAMQQFRKRSDGIRCQHNLRSVGMILLNAVAEKGSTAGFWYRGDTGLMWNTMLITDGYVTRQELRDMSCPSIPYAAENGSTSGRHYGVYMAAPESRIVRMTYDGKTGDVYFLPIRSHPSPAAALFLVDSGTAAGNPTIRAFPGKAGLPSATAGGIHLRHQGRANLFFLDGHIERSEPERLKQLGVEQILDEAFQLQTL